jgi:hypothetical protein
VSVLLTAVHDQSVDDLLLLMKQLVDALMASDMNCSNFLSLASQIIL